MSNLDRNKIHMDVLVFEPDGTFLTRYVESVIDRRMDDPYRMSKELEGSIRLSGHCAAGRLLVCADERLPKPLLVRARTERRDVFAVTTAVGITEQDADDGLAGLEDQSCVGIFESLEDAIGAIRANAGDMHELNRDVAIVERVTTGICGCSPYERHMFSWNDDRQSYAEAEWPDALRNTGCFAVE